MKKIGLLLISSSIVIMHAQQQVTNVMVNFITINTFQGNTKTSLSIAKPNNTSCEEKKPQQELDTFYIVQKESSKYRASSNWQEIMEIGSNKFITYDKKRTKRYKWESQNKPGEYVDFVQTYWPPSQWQHCYGSRLKPSCIIYINELKNQDTYNEFEQDICCCLIQKQNEFIEFLCDADKSFLKKAGFLSLGGFLSKEISQKSMMVLASRR